MSVFQRLYHRVLLLLLVSIGVDAVSPYQELSTAGNQVNAAQPVYQGDCGEFVSQCYKTCFGLGQVRIAYACSLANDIYSAYCGCGSTDETSVVLSLADIPSFATTTLQTTATELAVLTATSTATTTTTAISTFQTCICSYTTIPSTVLVTSTITQPTTVTAFTTTTTYTSIVGAYTSSVPAVVVASGTSSKRKRANSISFCSDIQIACTVECAASWSVPAVQYCQANAQFTQYSIACICKNNVNVVQQVIQAFNLLRPVAQQWRSLATTKVAATVTATVTSVATALATSRVTVVPTTVVSVYTTVVTTINTYACFTTIPTTSIITNIATPTVVTTATTVVTAVATSLYYMSVSVSGQAGPSYVAQAQVSHLAQPTSTTDSAQVFAILQDTSSDTLYNLVGVGPGDFQGQSLGAYSLVLTNDPNQETYFHAVLASLPTLAQGPPSYPSADYYNNAAETAIWSIDLVSLAIQLTWISPSGSKPAATSLQGYWESVPADSSFRLGGASDYAVFSSDYSGTSPVSYFLEAV